MATIKSIEGKATRYDEAIKIAKEYFNSPRTCFDIEQLCNIFPELAESEDERIRKSLIILLQHFCKGYRVPGLDFPVSYKDMLAWLEKQGEQKPDKIFDSSKLKPDPNPYWTKAPEYQLATGQNPAWSEEDDAKLKSILFHIEDVENKDVISWLKSLKDRVQPKQEWSEDDERYLNNTISYLKDATEFKETAKLCIDWLKSLKDRYTWKPSDEQMLAINTAINVLGKGTINGKYLIELQKQLKKLKG